MSLRPEHYSLTKDEVKAYWFMGSLATVKVGRAQSGNALSVVEPTIPVGGHAATDRFEDRRRPTPTRRRAGADRMMRPGRSGTAPRIEPGRMRPMVEGERRRSRQQATVPAQSFGSLPVIADGPMTTSVVSGSSE